MQRTWQETMKDAISEVLETMFFTPVEFAGALPPQPHFDCGSIIFMTKDDITHEAAVYFVGPYARMITANLLGKMDEEVNHEEIADAIKELANMVGGSFIFQGGLKDFKLSLPDFTNLTEDRQPAPRSGIPFYFDGDLFGLVTFTDR